MIWFDNWLLSVVQLFDHILRILMVQPFLSFFLGVKVFFVIIGLLSSMFRTGRKM